MYIEIEKQPLPQHLKPPERKCQRNLQAVIKFIESYFEHSSIHGYIYLVKREITLFEKCFWLVFLIISMCFCTIVALQSIERFNTKSTVVGLERDFYFWNTSLPSVTICPLKRLNNTLFNAYYRKNQLNDNEHAILFDFLESLANSTYMNFKNIHTHPNLDSILQKLNIKTQNYMELIYNLTHDSSLKHYKDVQNLQEKIYSEGNSGYVYAWQVLTEFGLCYVSNSHMSRKYSSHYFIEGKYPVFNIGNITFSNVVTRVLYDHDREFSLIGFRNTPIAAFLHSSYDVMSFDCNHFDYILCIRVEVESMEINAEDDFEYGASILQRKCRFQHESNLTHFPIYTRTLCIQECRLELVYKTCHCIPHFYPNRFTSISKEICSYRKLIDCVGPDAVKFLMLNEDLEAENCMASCFQNCLDSIVTLRNDMTETQPEYLFGGNGISISMSSTPTKRLKRQVIFSFTDLLVSIGGAAGLFIGFSVLSVMEMLYFFTLRLIWYMRGYKL